MSYPYRPVKPSPRRKGDIWVCGNSNLWRPAVRDLQHAYSRTNPMPQNEDYYEIIRLLIQAGF